ncbi:hypothetical protein BJ912DRAFT_1061417 [Pholiota molesta]|nr:hypothetical protein BJ912DRAFT_1061417 [Pholiota molesta]
MDEALNIYHALVLEDEEWDDEMADLEVAALSGTAIYLEASENRQRRSARRRRLYLVRNDLLPNPRVNTPWQRLLSSSSDRAYITTMGIDVDTFKYILDAGFTLLWNTTPLIRPDNPMSAPPRINSRSLDAAGGLGLILHYLNSTMREVSLMEIFALIPSTVSRYIEFCLDILLNVLRNMVDAAIEWPKGEQFEEYTDLVVARHPLLTGAFGTMDGLNLAVQESPNQEIENATYNGWLHDHFVSSVIAFGSTGMSKDNLMSFWALAGKG